MPTLNELDAAAEQADKAWMDAIAKAYPRERPGDVRYTRKAVATPELTALRDDWQAKCAAAHKASGFHH